MIKKIITISAAALLAAATCFADEGMWLPSLISSRIADMQANGFKLTAEDIYSVNQASLKDAVVLFGGGCTGELISDEGLLITNHHCGYSYIQRHSSVEHDYLKDGYWAMRRDQELVNPGLSVSFLDHMEDVTDAVLKGYKANMTEEQRSALVRKNSQPIIDKAVKAGKGLRASIEALYYGNQYFLFVYKTYRDVRFVGAPASSIGKFGGETDNWIWPRHTGDFSMFRVYADKDNEPADYSENNVPYHPKKFFKITTKGVQEGDFTFIYGFPGSTREYIHSEGVRYVAEMSDPAKIAVRDMRLEIMDKYMTKDQAVRIAYSSKKSGVANSWKKWQGEAQGIIRRKTVDTKKAYEAGFAKWAVGTPYEGLIEKFDAIYADMNPKYLAQEMYSETIGAIELLSTANSYNNANAARRKSLLESFYKDYYLPIDKESFAAVVDAYKNGVPSEYQPDWFKAEYAKQGSGEAWAEYMYANSVFANKEKALAMDPSTNVENDPAVVMIKECSSWVNANIRPDVTEYNRQLALLNRAYMKGQMEYEKNKDFYPDANMTLRVAYGHVEGYEPMDGVYYYPSSTLTGIIEKDNPEIFDYDIPQRLRDVYASGDYAKVPVCFIASNHTSGGNSGSPVISANGDLMGLNFDRVWEGTMSDIDFDPSFCRNICLDINYVLFVLDKVYDAQYVLKELTLVNR